MFRQPRFCLRPFGAARRLLPRLTRVLLRCVLLAVNALPLRGLLTVLRVAGVSGGSLRQPDPILRPAVRQVRVTYCPCRGGLLLRVLGGSRLALVLLDRMWLGGGPGGLLAVGIVPP